MTHWYIFTAEKAIRTEDEGMARLLAKTAHFRGADVVWEYSDCGDGYVVKKKRDKDFNLLETPRVLEKYAADWLNNEFDKHKTT